MREVWLIIRKRSSDCIEVRFGVILLLTSEDWDMWDNITNRWVYLMLDLGRSGSRLVFAVTSTETSQRSSSAFGSRTINV